MNDEQVNEYMQALLSGKREIKDFLERNALERFGNIATEIAQGQQRVQQLTAETERIRNAIQQLIGQRTAYSQQLVAAETARRGPEKMLSLVELRDKLGADKVEATDTEGNVVDSSEDEITSTDETETDETETDETETDETETDETETDETEASAPEGS